MKEAATLRGCDIGSASPTPEGVVVETKRGFMSVGLSADERLFLMHIRIPEFSWAIGSTDDIGSLVEAIAAWRDGMPFDELEARFGFLDLGELARALERREPASSQWSDLLSSDFYAPQRDLLRRIHADETLRGFFPVISHGAVRLRVDPLDARSRQVLVAERNGGRYDVLRVGVPGATWVEVAAGDLIACLHTALNASNPGPQ
ncbi:hypothetical protein [Streptomyces sp. NPDC046685]|uniref:hypothetical protein n=1 Tax=Streptomyces sp. NPDC046685 TaxID=3157202 RepID=UPI00340B055E